MIKNVKPKQARETLAITGNLMLAPMVAFMRLPMLALEAQSSNPFRTETMRAVTEKTAAVAEGAFAAQMSLVQSAFHFWPEMMSGRTPSVLNGVAAGRSMNAALKPASRRVKANYRRLTRSKS
jgi:hypothetical protein